MKTVLLAIDGLASGPEPGLAGQTLLDAAETPNLDRLAQQGCLGEVEVLPSGLPRRCDAGFFCLLGLPPETYTNIGPLEALGAGVSLAPRDTAYICQLVSSDGHGITEPYAGGVETSEAHRLMAVLEEKLEETWFRFYPGERERQLLVWTNGPPDLLCTEPNAAAGREVDEAVPQGEAAHILRRLIWDSIELLDEHDVNRRRRDRGLPPANMVWPWGPGRRPALEERVRPVVGPVAVVGANFARGAALLAGARVPSVPGATGWWDTSFRAKSATAIAAATATDAVVVHVACLGAPYGGGLADRVERLEALDNELVGRLAAHFEDAEERTRLVCVSTLGGSPEGEPSGTAPFIAVPSFDRGDRRAEIFSEAAAASTGLQLDSAAEFRRRFVQ